MWTCWIFFIFCCDFQLRLTSQAANRGYWLELGLVICCWLTIVSDCWWVSAGHDIHIEINNWFGSRIRRGRICLSYAANSSPAASLSRAVSAGHHGCRGWYWHCLGWYMLVLSCTINYFGESITDCACALRKCIEVYVMHVRFCVFWMRLHWQYMYWLYPKEHVYRCVCVCICDYLCIVHRYAQVNSMQHCDLRCLKGASWNRAPMISPKTSVCFGNWASPKPR